MKGLGNLMQQAQQVQEKMSALQAEIAALEVAGESGAGLVRVVMNGAHEVGKVQIDPSLMAEGTEVLEELIAAACNDAARKLEAAQRDKMSQLAGGLNPPLGKFFA